MTPYVRPSQHTGVLHGRGRELGCVARVLDVTASGRGAVLVVEGAAGTGKTELLAAAECMAEQHGFAVLRACPDESWQLCPLTPMLAALGCEEACDVDRGDLPNWTNVQLCLEHVAAQLESRAAQQPILIIFDDIDRADAMTLAAIRLLSTRLSKAPLAWLLARHADRGYLDTDWAFMELNQQAADTLELGPVPRSATADIMTDMLGGRPDQALMAFADGVSGNPMLLVELISGLCEEGNISVDRGQARLRSQRIPRRVENLILKQLNRLTPVARSMVEIAACEDKPVAVSDLIGLMSWTTSDPVTDLRQALAGDLVASVQNNVVSMPYSLVRNVVVEAITAAVRGDMLRVKETGQAGLGAKANVAQRYDRPLSRRLEPATKLVRARALGELADLHERIDLAGEFHGRPGNAGSGGGDRDQPARGWASLTATERTVAHMVADGLTNRQVAKRVHLSPHTVSFHLRKVYRKLNVGSRVELARSLIVFGPGARSRSVNDRQPPTATGGQGDRRLARDGSQRKQVRFRNQTSAAQT